MLWRPFDRCLIVKINLAPISDGSNLEAIAFGIEIAVMTNNYFRIDEIEWDYDLLRDWYISSEVSADDKSAYYDEPQLADDEARQSILSRIVWILRERSSVLNGAYPFQVEPEDGILLKRSDDLSCIPQTVCYLWFSLFRASHSPNDCILLTDDTRTYIHRTFSNVFEIVAGYALLAEQTGRLWLLGSSRSVTTLLRRLHYVTKATGSGRVKVHEDLEADQKHDNDGGVDLVQIVGGYLPTIQILGATIQKSNRRQKVMGQSARRRIRRFFHRPVTLPIEGIMAVPFPKSDADEIMCSEEDCRYMYDENLLSALGKSVSSARKDDRHLLARLKQHTYDLVDHIGCKEADFIQGCELAQLPVLMRSS